MKPSRPCPQAPLAAGTAAQAAAPQPTTSLEAGWPEPSSATTRPKRQAPHPATGIASRNTAETAAVALYRRIVHRTASGNRSAGDGALVPWRITCPQIGSAGSRDRVGQEVVNLGVGGTKQK